MSLQTLFRAAVMLIAGYIGYQAWQLYGPSTEQMQSIAGRAGEVLDETLQKFRDRPAELTRDVPDPRVEPSPFALAIPPMAPIPATPLLEPAAPLTEPAEPDAELHAMTDRLTELGAHDQRLDTWGVDGQMYRFCCSVPWAGSESFNRHFEAVAGDPLAAVRLVAAEIDLWRSARQPNIQMR